MGDAAEDAALEALKRGQAELDRIAREALDRAREELRKQEEKNNK